MNLSYAPSNSSAPSGVLSGQKYVWYALAFAFLLRSWMLSDLLRDPSAYSTPEHVKLMADARHWRHGVTPPLPPYQTNPLAQAWTAVFQGVTFPQMAGLGVPRLVQGVALCALAGALAWRLFGPIAAIAAILLAALSRQQAAMDLASSGYAISQFLFFLAAFLLVSFEEHRRWLLALLAGLFLGAASVGDPFFLLAFLVALLWFPGRKAQEPGVPKASQAGHLVAFTLAFLLPWAALLTAIQPEKSLANGVPHSFLVRLASSLSPDASIVWTPPHLLRSSLEENLEDFFQRKGSDSSNIEEKTGLSATFARDEVVSLFTGHPLKALWLLAARLPGSLWVFQEFRPPSSCFLASQFWSFRAALPFDTNFLLVWIAGLLLCWPLLAGRRAFFLVIGMGLAFAITAGPSSATKVILGPWSWVLGGCALATIQTRWKERTPRQTVLAAVLVLGFITPPIVRKTCLAAPSFVAQAEAAMRLGKPEQALTAFRKSAEFETGLGLARWLDSEEYLNDAKFTDPLTGLQALAREARTFALPASSWLYAWVSEAPSEVSGAWAPGASPLFRQATDLVRKQSFDEAYSTLASLKEHFPGDQELFAAQAAAAFLGRKFDQAAEPLRQAVALGNNTVEVHFLRFMLAPKVPGVVTPGQGEMIRSPFLFACAIRGEILKGNYYTAQILATNFNQFNPTDNPYFDWTGIVLNTLEQREKAVQTYRDAIGFQPKLASIRGRFAASLACLSRNHFAEAVKEWKQAQAEGWTPPDGAERLFQKLTGMR